MWGNVQIINFAQMVFGREDWMMVPAVSNCWYNPPPTILMKPISNNYLIGLVPSSSQRILLRLHLKSFPSVMVTERRGSGGARRKNNSWGSNFWPRLLYDVFVSVPKRCEWAKFGERCSWILSVNLTKWNRRARGNQGH